jgi:dihydrofolate reductase
MVNSSTNKNMIKLIVAISKNRVIGDSNKLIWHLPADLKRFKEITSGHSIVMGRKTYQSIGRPLPNRRNIIITRDEKFQADGCEVVNSIEESLLLTNSDCFIIGGGEIYRQAIYLADQIYMTIIDENFDGDTTFPELDRNWYISKKEDMKSDEKNSYNYSFIFYERFEF